MKARAFSCSSGASLRRAVVPSLIAAFLVVLPLRSLGDDGDGWYADTLRSFVSAGYVQPRDFGLAPHPNGVSGAWAAAPATRGAFLDLLLRLKGGVVHGPFATATFDDVLPDDPRFFTFEEAAAQGWVRGAENCRGSHPCLVFPRRAINRAEAAAILVRSFGLTALPSAPVFRDTTEGAWYFEPLRIAAGHCIFRGDDGENTVRPADTLNQAEMLSVLRRTLQGLAYPDCQGVSAPLPPAPASLQMQLPLPALPQAASSSSSSQAGTPAPSNSSATQAGTPASSETSSTSSTSTTSATSSTQAGVSTSSNSSSSSQAGTPAPSAPDSGYAAFVSKYDQYVALFGTCLEATKTTENAATVQALNLLKAQMEIIAAFYQYVAIARQRSLTEGERQVALSLMTTIEKGFANIRSVQSGSGSLDL